MEETACLLATHLLATHCVLNIATVAKDREGMRWPRDSIIFTMYERSDCIYTIELGVDLIVRRCRSLPAKSAVNKD